MTIRNGDYVEVDTSGERYIVQQIVPAKNGALHEYDSLVLKNVANHGMRVWSTGGYFPDLRKVGKEVTDRILARVNAL